MGQGFLRAARKITQLVCVLAVAVASLLHVCLDARSVTDARPIDAQAPAFALASNDASHAGDATTAGERCHSCSVVSAVVFADVPRIAAPPALIPAGSFLHVAAFLQPTTNPPPRA